jgi:RHS repeat-associated protein
LNQSYLQDENGNVIQREAVVNSQSLYENFYYDADNRLCADVVGGTGGCTTPTIVYDGGSAGPGNITSQTGVGTYAYPAPGQPRPHAVTSLTGTLNGISNPSFSYDLNGNMIKRASSTQNVSWSSYNYPVTISGSDATGSEEVQFSYGPDRQRWEQIYTGPSGTETTYYVGNNLEVVFNGTTNYRHYIYAGSEPVAVYNRTSAGATMSYMLEDHQGGVAAITSNSGTVGGTSGVDESFTAFGQRRNAETWYGAPTTGDLNTIAGLSRQGYTWQTWLGQSMGLNHMNGRVEDAILGRFLSPDPHIPDPTNAQSYNRYSYVNNNPMTLVDPTGFSAKTCPEGGSCGGGDPDASNSSADDATPSDSSANVPPSMNPDMVPNSDSTGNSDATPSAAPAPTTDLTPVQQQVIGDAANGGGSFVNTIDMSVMNTDGSTGTVTVTVVVSVDSNGAVNSVAYFDASTGQPYAGGMGYSANPDAPSNQNLGAFLGANPQIAGTNWVNPSTSPPSH